MPRRRVTGSGLAELAKEFDMDNATAQRFWTKVDKTGDCWLWTGYIKPNGYANFYAGGGRGAPKPYVHRIAYELRWGPIPDGLEVDHLCNVRHCVNPGHLEVVSRGVNLDRRDARRTACRNGHEYTPDNIYRPPGNRDYRYCRECQRLNAAKRLRGPSVKTL